MGHTGAGAVNLALKTGTNQFHGSASYYNRDDSRSANLFASIRSGSGKTPRDYNRFSGAIGGPIFRNKTFFMFSYEKLQDDTIEPFTSSVPTARMRNGDFSELLSNGVQIFDPRTARLVNGVVVRDPFPGNIIPGDRINPSRATCSGISRPQQAAAADFSQTSSPSNPGRMATTSRWCASTTSGRATSAPSAASSGISDGRRYNFAGELNGVEITRGATDRFNFNYAVGHTAVLSPTTVLDLKGSWLRFNDDLFPLYDLDLASLGYSSSTLGLFGGYSQLPRFNLESSSPTAQGRVATPGAQQSGFNSGRHQPFYNLQFSPTVTKTAGSHTWKLGYDWRQLRQTETNLGWKGGAYAFDVTFTRSTSAAASQYGQGIAAFMLGIPSTGSILETRSNYDARINSHSAFVHDDWRVSDRLTLNLGLRYDLELGLTEVENRNIGGFDLTTTNPIEAQARANFAASPPAGVPIAASAFNVRGGYPIVQRSNISVECRHEQLPAARGFTYKLSDKSVLRGGAGLFIAPFQIQGVPGITTGLIKSGTRAIRPCR